MIWQLVLMTAFNVVNAFIDAKRIKANKLIYHGISAAIYLSLYGLMVLFFKIHLWKAIFYFLPFALGGNAYLNRF